MIEIVRMVNLFQPEPDEVVEALAIARGVFEAAVSRLPFDARR